MYAKGALALGQRLLRQDRPEAALQIFRRLQQDPSISPTLLAKTAREADAIEGRGALGRRIEYQLGNFAEEAASPSLILGMAAAGVVYGLSRAAILGRLLASPTAGLATRGLGARTVAGVSAFTLEAPTFVAATHGAQQVLGSTRTGTSNFTQELAGAFLSLGGLKLFAFGGERALRLAGGGALTQAAIPQLSAYLGLLAGRGLEHATGLRPFLNQDTWLLDSLATLVQFQVGGQLAHGLMGSRFARFRRELDLAAHESKPSTKPPRAALIGTAFATGPSATSGEIFSNRPFAMRDIRGRSGFLSSQAALGTPLNLNIKWVPEGASKLIVAESSAPVDEILAIIETHIHKIHPSSLEIQYQGRMLTATRDQEKLKEGVRRLIESRPIPEGFVVAIGFLKGTPQMALAYIKEGKQMRTEWANLRVPEPASAPTTPQRVLGSSASAFSQVEGIREKLGEILQTRNPKVFLDGTWSIRDQMSISELLEQSEAFTADQSFTVLLREKSAQIVFSWTRENGVKRVGWKTQPIDAAALRLAPSQAALPRNDSSPEITALDPHSLRSTPPPSEGESAFKLNHAMNCKSADEALETVYNLLLRREASPATLIEIREGRFDETYLGILGNMLNESPLSEGRKISFLWQGNRGMLKIQNDQGRITAEVRKAGQPIEEFLLKPDPAVGKRFVRYPRKI